jgi:hypothetical protein
MYGRANIDSASGGPHRRNLACLLEELLSYAKLAGMRGADLVAESPREDQDDREGDHVHELCDHEYGIADGDRMSEKDR